MVYLRAKSGQELKAEPRDRTEAEAIEEHCLLCGLLSLFSNTTQDHMPDGGTTHCELGPPTLVINLKNAPINLPTGQYDGGSSLDEFLPSQICLGLCQADTKPACPKTSFIILLSPEDRIRGS